MKSEGFSEHEGALEQAFFRDGYQLATDLLKAGDIESAMHQAVAILYQALDGFIDMFLEEAAEKQPCHCRRGCSWCCHQAVFAHTHELKYLKKWLFEQMNAEELERVRKRAAEKHANTAGLSAKQKLQYKESCPLLEDGACMAYAARPVACRIYLSMDVHSCKHEFSNPSDRTTFPRLYSMPLLAGRNMNAGFVAGLREAGHNTREYALEEGLLI